MSIDHQFISEKERDREWERHRKTYREIEEERDRKKTTEIER